MTILSLDSSACATLATDNRPSKIGGRPVPRVNLRKRPSPAQAENDFSIPHVTSDFLSSLFSEVNHSSSTKHSETLESPSKRIRRSFKSFTNLAPWGRESSSPVTTNTAFFDQDFRGSDKQHANLVSSSYDDATEILFPSLPPTVSDPSCSRTNLSFAADQQSSVAETCPTDADEDKDTYGWFVVVDDDDDILDKPQQAVADPLVSKDLAFCAPTAPKAPVVDDVHWAQAADTVDDVLADFF